MRWLTLLLSLPTRPSRHRVGVWRKLRRMGAVNLRGAAWVLPETPETAEWLQWLAQEIQSLGGEATLLAVERSQIMTGQNVVALFHKARAEEYDAVVHGCQQLLAQLDRQRAGRRGRLDPMRARLDALKRELDRVRAIDYLESPHGRRAQAAWERAAAGLRALAAREGAGGPRRHASLPPSGSTWVTRPRPHIDRIASAWLIKRYGDPDARFVFADPADAPKKGVPFDILGAEFGHHGEDCTFETLVKRFGIRDRRVQAIAEIVHEADLHDGKFARAEAAGLDLALKGLAAATADDHELLERGMALFDGLHSVLKQKG